MNSPLVSVLMPVYNAEKYLAEAVSSILTQSYGNFELIIINDGSTDGSADIIAGYSDPRIRLHTQENRGLSTSLNRAIQLATGRYLARQDADDVSFPERFAKQVAFLESHPEYCMLGTWSEIWVEATPTERAHRHPYQNGALKFNLLFDNFFVHSSVMLRKSALDQVGFYTAEKSRQPEDYDLWSRLLRGRYGKMANIPEMLLAYREVEGSICRSDERSFTDEVIKISMANLAACSGREITDPAIGDLAALAHHAFDRISARPDFKAMLSVMLEAAARLDADSGLDSGLKTEICTRYARIKKAYLLHRWHSFSGRVRKFLHLPPL